MEFGLRSESAFATLPKKGLYTSFTCSTGNTLPTTETLDVALPLLRLVCVTRTLRLSPESGL